MTARNQAAARDDAATAEALRAAGHVVDRTLVLTRTFDAPRALVFKVWTQPEHLVRWWGCPKTKTASFKGDFRPGGAYRVVMRLEDGTDHVVTGVFKEVTEPARLSFTWGWEDADGKRGHETLVTVIFTEKGAKKEKTELSLHHAIFESVEMRDQHGWGWTASLDRLAGVVADVARAS